MPCNMEMISWPHITVTSLHPMHILDNEYIQRTVRERENKGSKDTVQGCRWRQRQWRVDDAVWLSYDCKSLSATQLSSGQHHRSCQHFIRQVATRYSRRWSYGLCTYIGLFRILQGATFFHHQPRTGSWAVMLRDSCVDLGAL